MHTSVDSITRPTICQVLHSLTIGGAEVLAYRLGTRLSERYRFVFACLDGLGVLGEELRTRGFVVEVLGRKPGLDLACARRLGQFFRRYDAHIIHAHQYTPFFYSLAAGLLVRRPGVLFTEHGRFFPDLPNRKRMLYNRLLLRRKDRLVGVGGAVRQALIDNEGMSAKRVQVIYNGVDLERFSSPTLDYRSEVRREFGVSGEEIVAMMVARLDPLKDHLTALRAIAHMDKEGSTRIRLILVGEGPERPRIEEFIEQHGLRSHVTMLGMYKDVARALAAADLFVLSSISEGIPVTLIEAMGMSLPVVATNVGGVHEVVEHGLTGLLVPSGDDRQLADAISRLAANAELRTEMGRSGRERAQRIFSEPNMHEQYCQMYEDMLDAR